MSEEEKIESSQEDRKPESLPALSAHPEEVHDELQFVNRDTSRQMRGSIVDEEVANENISHEKNIEQTETTNPRLTGSAGQETSDIPKSEIKKMEVHHHPKIEKKNFKEYLLEGLMIFLAVTLGFFAENIREHITEERNANQFLQTYRNELLQQQQQIIIFENRFKDKLLVCDSIVEIYYNGEENKKLDYLAASALKAKGIINIPFNTSSYEQMVSSGALRYIMNADLRDSIASYKNQIEGTKAYNNEITDAIIKSNFEIGKIEDLHDFISADTSSSYNFLSHVPAMKPFQKLTEEQRRELITFYMLYMAQAQSNLLRLRVMYESNKVLVEMINKQLN